MTTAGEKERTSLDRQVGSTEGYPFKKLSALASIKEFVQEVAVAIASVTKVDVTVVDDNLVRIAGSGKYIKELDTILSSGTISDQVLKTGKTFVIENPRDNENCSDCGLRDKCRELAEISFPFKLHGKTTGNIALIAFTEEQRDLLLDKKEDYIDFLSKTAVLLEHRIDSMEKSRQVSTLSRQLEMIINKMDQGIVFADRRGIVQIFNDIARRYLGKKLRSGVRISKPLPEISLPLQETSDQLFTRDEETCSYSVKFVADIGALIEVHHVSFLQEKEHAIRRRMSTDQNIAIASFDDLVGHHPSFMESVNLARRFSRVDATVLITAETGTGKDLFAQSIHNLSLRRSGPYVAINCGALPESLLESELFGYETGAFTGAKRGGKMGLFEQAHGGTILLDEIAEMPLALQSSLLRVLQNKEVRRVGGERLIPVDVRVIAATNKQVRTLVSKGDFRDDLFYRLNMLRLRIPPLRDRASDIPLLVQHFAIEACRKYKRHPLAFSKAALDRLCTYNWPGNIRELYNVVHRAVLMSETSLVEDELVRLIMIDYTDPSAEEVHRFDLVLDGSFKNISRQIIEGLIKRYGDEGQVAELLGLSKTTIWRRLNDR